MNYTDKIISCIRRTIPYYEYNTEDFMVMDTGNGPYIGYWNSSFSTPQPLEDDINSVTQEEYENNIKINIIYNNPGIKFETNVGNLDYNISVAQLVGGIIYGEPIGTKTWTLPNSKDIVKFFLNKAYVGKIFTATFSNMSVVKNIKINLGEGMTSRNKNIILNSTVPVITLMFKIENIDNEQESVSVIKL